MWENPIISDTGKLVRRFAGGIRDFGHRAAMAQSAGLLGDMGGLRTVLGNYGITLGITDSENLLGNLSRRR